jgi:hypothetical protein
MRCVPLLPPLLSFDAAAHALRCDAMTRQTRREDVMEGANSARGRAASARQGAKWGSTRLCDAARLLRRGREASAALPLRSCARSAMAGGGAAECCIRPLGAKKARGKGCC